MYEYYKSRTNNPIDKDSFLKEVKNYKNREDKFVVYFGYSRKDKSEKRKVIYVGTTIQHPMSRWFYHSTHNKNLDFEIAFRFDNAQDMLIKEYEEIKRLRPSMNKIKDRQQNLNVELTKEILETRKGDSEWCQCCMKRRVSKCYRYCYFCSIQ